MVLLLNSISMEEELRDKHDALPQNTFALPCGMKESEIKHKTKSKMLREYEEKMRKPGNKRPLSRIPLWYFLHEILEVEKFRDLIAWKDEKILAFTIKKPKELAILWGQIKNKENMTYPKLARGIRYYYGKGVIEKFNGKRFSYKFVVSRKTKNVLSKRKHLPEEVIIQPKKYKNRKRKSPTSDSSNIDKKRFLEQQNVNDHTQSNGSDCGSDEDEPLSEFELKILDESLSEIFNDPRLNNYVAAPSAGDIVKQGKDELFVMKNGPIDFLKLPPLNYTLQAQQISSTVDQRTANFSPVHCSPINCSPVNYSPVNCSPVKYEERKTPQQSINTSNMEIYDIYKQLTEEIDTICDNVCQKSNNMVGNKPNQLEDIQPSTFHSQLKNLNKKRSKTESKTYYDYQTHQTSLESNVPVTNVYRAANISSLPDFSNIGNSLTDLNTGFFTNLLLQNNTSHGQCVDIDKIVLDDVLNL